MTVDHSFLARYIRDIQDFPEPGVLFKDITPLLADVDAFRYAVDAVADHWAGTTVDRVVGVEARGFIFAAPIAYRLGAGLVPVRKAGKLPHEVAHVEYDLEYGTDRLEVHLDGIEAGQRVVIVDDVLATGGTAAATGQLIRNQGGSLAGYSFLVELEFLKGRKALDPDVPVQSLLVYPGGDSG